MRIALLLHGKGEELWWSSFLKSSKAEETQVPLTGLV